MEDDRFAPEEMAILVKLHDLHRSVVRWLGTIILVAVISIGVLAIINSQTINIAFLSPDEQGDSPAAAGRGGQTDQAVAILGNIAAAGIGGLVGWWARDFRVRTRNVSLEGGRLPGGGAE